MGRSALTVEVLSFHLVPPVVEKGNDSQGEHMYRPVYFSLLFGLQLALPMAAQAFDLFPSKVDLPVVPTQLQEIREFLQKHYNTCLLAVAQIPQDGKFNNYTILAWKKQLRCVTDLKTSGGLDNPSGCAYVFFDAGENIYTPVENMTTFGHGTFIVAKDQTCDSGGFETLLKMKIGVYGMSVQQDLMGVIKGNNLFPVVAKTKKYLEWFNNNNKK